MKERPILFSSKMVNAILEGRKTQTRRVVKPGVIVDAGDPSMWLHARPGEWAIAGDPMHHLFISPYGKPGDRLWVRETWKLEEYAGTRLPEILYRADMDSESAERWGPWRPSIFMKRGVSRLTLEVTQVRVQRLHEITEEDARAEGVQAAPFCKSGRPVGMEHVESFEDLWQSINGERDGCSWESNPWVWCVSFKPVSPSA